MKLRFLVFVSFLISLSVFAANEIWFKVTTSEFGNIFYVDTPTIKFIDRVVSYKLKVELGKPTPSGGKTLISWNKIDCNAKTNRTLSATVFDVNGNILTQGIVNQPPEILTPQAEGYTVYELLCNYM